MRVECSLCKEIYHSDGSGMCDDCISIITQDNDMHNTIELLRERIRVLEEELKLYKKVR